jgi:hypothetical protein
MTAFKTKVAIKENARSSSIFGENLKEFIANAHLYQEIKTQI